MPITQYQVLDNGNLLYRISAITDQQLDLGTYSVWVLNAPDAKTAAVIRQDPGITLQASSDPLPNGAPSAPTDGVYTWVAVNADGAFAGIESATVDAQTAPGYLYFFDALGTLLAIVPQPPGVTLIREDCILDPGLRERKQKGGAKAPPSFSQTLIYRGRPPPSCPPG